MWSFLVHRPVSGDNLTFFLYSRDINDVFLQKYRVGFEKKKKKLPVIQYRFMPFNSDYRVIIIIRNCISILRREGGEGEGMKYI